MKKNIFMLALMVPMTVEPASVSELKRKYEQRIEQEAKEKQALQRKPVAVKPVAVEPVVAPIIKEAVKPTVTPPAVAPIKKEPEKPIQKKKMNQKEATQLLVTGIEEGNVAKVQEALDQGANTETYIEKKSALMNAVIAGNVEIARLLLSKGARIGNALAEAALNGDEKMVTLLLRTGEISEASFNNAFNNAFDFGRANIIKLFIQRRPMLLNLQAINGQTLLMEAIEYGHRNIVELLLSYGADTQLKDKNGLTALDYALRKDHKDIIRLLTQGLPNAQEEIKKAWSRIKKYEKREKEQHLKVQEELKRGYRH